MAVSFYNQGDQDIYAGGEHFIPQERFRLGYMAPPSIANAQTTSGITNTQAASPYIWPPQGGGGGIGGGGPGSSNKFGLNMDTLKTISQPRYVEQGGPGNMYGGNYVKDDRDIAQTEGGIWKDVKTGQNVYHGNIQEFPSIIKKGFELAGLKQTGDPYAGSTDEYSAGNGSIMRLAPIPMFYYPHQDKILHYASESSRTTHGTMECLDACRLMSSVIHNTVRGQDKQSLLIDHGIPLTAQKIMSISQGGYLEKTEEQIRGSGYVVDCLEAALWCFHKTTTFKESILAATNLGDDADTTAAVCGQIAGAFYGESAIPKEWIGRLYDYSKVSELADALISN